MRTHAVVVMAGLGLAGVVMPAAAQQVMTVRSTMGMGGDGGAGVVSKRSFERYAAILGLTADQKAAAEAIHEGYASAFEDARKARREAMQAIRRAAEDADDPTIFGERMPAVEKTWTEESRRLDRAFFEDLRALAPEGAEGPWGAVERMRRREVELPRGSLSGESVDLIEVVEGLKLPTDAAAAVTPALEEYELDLDRVLAERQRMVSGAPGFEPGKPLDIEAMQKSMNQAREAGAKVREVNERHARKLEGLIPEDRREAFAAEVRKRSFPRVYRASRPSRDLEAALKLADLDGTQREQLQSIQESYERDLGAANEAWARAIRESEADEQHGNMVTPSGAQLRMRFGDEPEPLAAARKARRDLDEKTGARLRQVLSPSQVEKLPKDQPEGERMEVTGGAMMIIDERR